MRVLIAAANLGKWGETDGIVTTYGNLIPRFVKAGVRADIMAYGPEDSVEQHGDVRIIIHKPRIPVKIDPTRWIDMAIYQSSTAQMINQETYDLVQSSTPDPLGLYMLSMAKRNKCPFLSIYHTALGDYVEIRYGRVLGPFAGKMFGNMMSSWMKWYYEQSDLILTPSHWTMRELNEIFSKPIGVLGRGINTDDFSPAHRRREDDGRVRAVYIGRVAPEKNLKVLVDIFSRHTDIDLTVVGDGPYLEEMQRLLPHADFRGKLMGQELRQAYADGDIFVFPSLTDTLGNVVIEAMSSGLPAIVSNHMGPQEWVEHGVTGYVTENAEQFEKSLLELATEHELRKKMSRAARAYAETRTWDRIFEHLMKYYEFILNGSKSREKLAEIVKM